MLRDRSLFGQTRDTVLHIAAEYGFEVIASLLIAQGAPIRARNAAGQTARDMATDGGDPDIVAMIDHACGRGTFV